MSNIRRYRQLNFPTKQARLALYAVFVRSMCGLCAVFVRSMCGLCAALVRSMCGVCAVYVRCLRGVCAILVRLWCGLCAIYVRSLCYFGAVYVRYFRYTAHTPRKYRKKESAGGLIKTPAYMAPRIIIPISLKSKLPNTPVFSLCTIDVIRILDCDLIPEEQQACKCTQYDARFTLTPPPSGLQCGRTGSDIV